MQTAGLGVAAKVVDGAEVVILGAAVVAAGAPVVLAGTAVVVRAAVVAGVAVVTAGAVVGVTGVVYSVGPGVDALVAGTFVVGDCVSTGSGSSVTPTSWRLFGAFVGVAVIAAAAVVLGTAAVVTGALVLVTGAALGERSTVVAGTAVGVTVTASSTLKLVTSNISCCNKLMLKVCSPCTTCIDATDTSRPLPSIRKAFTCCHGWCCGIWCWQGHRWL